MEQLSLQLKVRRATMACTSLERWTVREQTGMRCLPSGQNFDNKLSVIQHGVDIIFQFYITVRTLLSVMSTRRR